MFRIPKGAPLLVLTLGVLLAVMMIAPVAGPTNAAGTYIVVTTVDPGACALPMPEVMIPTDQGTAAQPILFWLATSVAADELALATTLKNLANYDDAKKTATQIAATTRGHPYSKSEARGDDIGMKAKVSDESTSATKQAEPIRHVTIRA